MSLLKTAILLFVVFTACLCVERSSESQWEKGTFVEFSVKHNVKHDSLYIVNRFDEDGIANVKCSNTTLFSQGWNRFNAKANSAFDPNLQFRAIGFADSYCFHTEIKSHWENVNSFFQKFFVKGGKYPQGVYTWLKDNHQWIVKMVEQNKDDTYWQNIGYMLSQYTGFAQGYQAFAPANAKMSFDDLWMYLSVGDLLDLVNAVKPDTRMVIDNMTPEEIKRAHLARDHCSGLTRLTDDNQDIYIAHNAWFSFSTMSRVVKQIQWGTNASTKANKIAFSSYPGYSFSFDDFMISDRGLAMFETTNECFNHEVYDKIKVESVLTWMRSTATMIMSDDPKEWTENFAKYNSGTYNNQWQILDYKKFTPGQPLKENTFWVLEQAPDYIEAHDQSEYLQKNGFVPSFNIPFYPKMFKYMGYDKAVKKAGDYWTWEACPRANIFRRESVKVNTMKSMKETMRFNDYKNDPFTLGDPCNSIASRCDLQKNGNRMMPYGAMDGKITSFEDIKNMHIHTISSPTYDQQPVFSWKTCPKEFLSIRREGLPETWNFPWMRYDFE